MDLPLVKLEENKNIEITTTNSQTSLNLNVNIDSTEVINRLKNAPYIKLYCPSLMDNENQNYYYITTCSSINDESPSEMNEQFLFLIRTKFEGIWGKKEFELYTGANQDTADNYFCKYYIEGITYCQQCDKNCPCQFKDRIFKPMTLEIAPNKFDENQNKHEISYGSIERIQKKCNDYGIRRFYGYNKNDYKYFIGFDDACCCFDCNCNCENVYCKIRDYSILCCCYSGKKRFVFKQIYNRNSEICGEINMVFSYYCCSEKSIFELKFPNDADVPMKLLLIGGLIDACFEPYLSVPEVRNKKVKSLIYDMNKSIVFNLTFFFSLIIILIIVINLLTKS